MEICNKKLQKNEKLHCKNNAYIIKNGKKVESYNKDLKVCKKYGSLNNNYIIKNNKEDFKNNDVYEIANKNIYIDNYVNNKICARVEGDEGIFFDKLNNKTNSIKLNKKQLGVNVVNSVGDTQNKKASTHHKAGNYIRGNIKSVPKNITTAIICMWLFVLCACLALVVGVGYLHTKNYNLYLPNTTTAEGSTFSGGDGTESNPYQIATYADLKALSTTCNAGEHYADKYFKVINDITIDNTDSATEWVPIGVDLTSTGTPVNYFSGVFDGANHIITIKGGITEASSSTTSFLYFGALFGYVSNGELTNINVDFVSTSTDCLFFKNCRVSPSVGYAGCIVGFLNNSTMNDCAIGGDTIIVYLECCNFGGFVGGATNVTIDNCVLNATITINNNASSSFEHNKCAGGIVGYVSSLSDNVNITNCNVQADLQFGSLYGASGVGAIAGGATVVENCSFIGDIFEVSSASSLYLGGIVGYATEVRNCQFIGTNISDDASIKMDLRGGSEIFLGGIVGYATTVENCYIDASISKFSAHVGDGHPWAGIIAGHAITIKNCLADVYLASIESYNFSVIAGEVGSSESSISNCVIIVNSAHTGDYSLAYVDSSTMLNAYNCVVIGATYGITNSNTATTDATNGLYALASDDTSLGELKKSATYSGTGANGFTWNTTDGTAWDFANTWTILNEGEDYPTLQCFLNVDITINVSTNLSSSNNEIVEQFIIYKLDSNNNVVNQFVVTNGSAITFETMMGKSFTIMINHKLYMVTTIDGESAVQKSYTPTEDTTINITITAPSGVNNWIVI